VHVLLNTFEASGFAQLLALAALATAEFCTNPVEGGVGEPQFCRMTSRQEVSTPNFSIVVEPNFLVAVYDQGRKVQIQSTIRQAMDVLTIEAVEGSRPPLQSVCPEITETVEDNVTWHDCRSTAEGIHSRRLIAEWDGHYVVIEYSYGRLSASRAPALERMTQSIRIHIRAI
jgi:hypothetical protein